MDTDTQTGMVGTEAEEHEPSEIHPLSGVLLSIVGGYYAFGQLGYAPMGPFEWFVMSGTPAKILGVGVLIVSTLLVLKSLAKLISEYFWKA